MSDCNVTNATIKAGEWIFYISKGVILPWYVIIGTVCNVVLLVAFYKQSKLEKPYVYQVLLTISKTLEVIVFGTFLLGEDWFSGLVGQGVDWFRKSYLMWFITFKFGAILHIHFIISSVLLSAAMATDRAFALVLPFRYKNINHGRHQMVAGLVCFSLPAMASVGDVWFWTISPEGDHYNAHVNIEHLTSTISQFCSSTALTLRMIALVVLIAMNVVGFRAFSKRTKTLTKIGQQKIAAETKAAERTLLLLSVSQSILMCFNQIPHTTFQVLLFTAPPSVFCSIGGVLSPLADGFIFITDMLDMVVLLTVNERIRSMVKRAFRWGCWRVTPAEGQGGNSQEIQAANVRKRRQLRGNTSAAVHG